MPKSPTKSTASKHREQNSLRVFAKRRATLKVRSGKADPRIGPYMYFFHCLSDQSASIKEILRLIVKAERTKAKILADLNSRNRLSADLNDVMAEINLQSATIEQEELQDVLAGSLFVILNSLLRSMAKRTKLKGGKEAPVKAGRKVGATSMYELIRAASNNFRHHEEWNKGVLKNSNIKTLKKAGLKGPWDRNLCSDVLKLIEWKEEEKLSLEMRKLAQEIFQAQTGIPL